MKVWYYFFIILIGSYGGLLAWPQLGYAESFSENQIQAAFIYKITKFIRWPENRLLAKLASTDKVQGVYGTENRNLHEVGEDLSTGTTPQFTDEVEFRKKSNEIDLCFMADEEDSNGYTVVETIQKLTQSYTKNIRIYPDIKFHNISQCEMLYIGKRLSGSLKDILVLASKQPIVTVSNIAGFSRRGGMFSLIADDEGKIRIELNVSNAKKRGIDINSDLLDMISVVR